jgi:hypothetical protein
LAELRYTAATRIAAGDNADRNANPAAVALTLLFLAVPSIAVMVLGKRSDVVLPKVKSWMDSHSWIVSEIVLAFFTAITINSLVGG